MSAIAYRGPVFIGGTKSKRSAGHAFVADGCYSYNFQKHVKIIRITDIGISDALPFFYDTLYEGQTSEWGNPYLHLNLGFESSDNGYFHLDDLAGYNEYRKAIINIRPNK